MSEMAPEHPPRTTSPLVVTQDLATILTLSDRLLTQAVRGKRGASRALAELAPVANLEAWEHQHETGERGGPVTTSAADEYDDEETAYQKIKYWSERWRRARASEYDDQKVTLTTEVNFLRWSLEWAIDHEPAWESFTDDIGAARRILENVLLDGHRDIISDDVSCLMCGAPLRRRMTEKDGYEDEWWCHKCHVHLTPPQFNLAASEAARRAVGMMVDSDNEVG